MFLDPLAAKTLFQSEVNITLIPLGVQRNASSFSSTLNWLGRTEKTPEAVYNFFYFFFRTGGGGSPLPTPVPPLIKNVKL